MKYAAILEPTDTGWCGYFPDFDGCVATGETLAETIENLEGGLEMHISAMREDGDVIPEPSRVEFITPKKVKSAARE